MCELNSSGAPSRKRWPVISIAAALLGAAVLCQPHIAHAAPHGGGGGFHGGFHGGGFHGAGLGALHGGGFHGHTAGLHNGFGGDQGHWYHGSHNGRYGWWWGDGLGWSNYPYAVGWDNYDYDNYSQPYANQTWYYCSDPAGYYPYVTQCNTSWQAVPAS